MREAYIVSAVRTPGTKKDKGGFAQTRPESLITHILESAVKRAGIEKDIVDDIMIGCAFPEAEQGLNIGRIAAQIAGFPDHVTGATVNRFCASGLESIALSSMRIMCGWAEVVIAGGLESMSTVPMGGNQPRPHPETVKIKPELYVSMGITAEIVAKKYNVTRVDQDDFALHSHLKAVEAQKNGYFTEIVPTPADKFTEQKDGTFKHETVMQDRDDGVRGDTTAEVLAKLKPAFAAAGSVTAGNSSQTTDGAAALVIMSGDAVKKYGLKPVAKFSMYTTTGCRPEEMGIGPALAIPKLLKMAGLRIEDIGLFEINEAFASQAIYSAREIGIGDRKFWAADSSEKKLNINGGAIALGHPLGCTGSKLAATLLANMQRLGKKYAVESMCIGGGMGAAALFELCD